ncbi:MAG: glycosyltransferase family 9 protein [Planctomycetota bacterium]
MNLVFQQAALGDFALILPLLRGLEGPKTFVGPWSRGRLAAALVEDCSHVDIEMFEFTRFHTEEGPHTLSPMVAELFERALVIVSFVSDGEDDWAANVVKWAPQCNLLCLPVRPPGDGFVHVVDYHREQLLSHGIALAEVPTAVTGDPAGPVVIHPGSGGREKCWPLDRFEALVRAYRKHHRPVRVIYGEAEAERWPQEELERWHAEYDAVGCGSLECLVEQLLNASAYIGNDAGPTHLAAQLGLPTTALFGPSDPTLWSPRGAQVNVVVPDSPTGMDWLSVNDLLGRLGLDGE